ncbi:MAG: hypothetical protein V4513_08995 [Pseudomonadota bacterium]
MSPAASRSPKPWFSARPEWAALLTVALVAAFRAFGTVDSDVAWQLWTAHHLNQGAQLYRDIVEINPPLWFWMALPVDRAASLAGLRPETALVWTTAALQALSLVATSRLLTLPRGPKTLLLVYAALVLAAFPWVHAGQREQIVLIAALPYAALIAARRGGRPVPPGFALLIGIGAGLGFALKHYFLIVPALLELWLFLRQRRGWSLVRPEIAGLAAVGLLYAGAILLFARDFLTVTLPMIRLAYGVTGAPALAQLFQPLLLLSLAIVAVAAFHLRLARDRQSDFVQGLLVAAIGFALVYFIQAKGWPYHAIPLFGCGAIALAALLASLAQPPRPLRIAGPVLLALPFVLTWQETRHPLLPSADLKAAVAGVKPGTSVGFLATEPAFAWSVTLQHRFTYPSRYIGYWMMRAVVANEARPNPEPALAAFGRQVVRDTITDFRCAPPQRIIVNRPTPAEAARGEFDILAWFQRDPEFAALMGHYRHVSRTSADVYDLASPLPPPVPGSCRMQNRQG